MQNLRTADFIPMADPVHWGFIGVNGPLLEDLCCDLPQTGW